MPTKKQKSPLSVTHPELAKEADGWDPNSWRLATDLVSWRCTSGHIYEAQIVERRRGKGCPFCSGRRVLKGLNDLVTTHPDLAKEAFGWEPEEYSSGSATKQEWKCEKGHIFESFIYSRALRGDKCSYCSGRKVLPGFNDLATTHPELSKEADGWDPTLVIAGSNKKFDWICHKGHRWNATLNNRSGKNAAGCAVCTNKLVVPGVNDLLTTHPEVAKQADGWDPATVLAGSGTLRNWKCSLGHRWSNSPHQHLKSRTGCPICANRRILIGFNDLGTTHPELAKQAFDWDPRTVTAGHDKKKLWKCELGHIYKSAPYQRTGSQASGCPVCDNKVIIPGFNDLKTTFPEMAKQAFGWDPTLIAAGHNLRKEWKCELGHIWIVSPQNRFQKNQVISNCPICAGDKVLKGFNDLATRHPHLANEADGWDPATIIAGHTKRKWKCEAGHNWMASAISRIVSGVGCPTCSKTGFNPNADGYLYFLTHARWMMQQIGITNNPDKRIGGHRNLGWDLVELRGPMDGHLTQQWETAILRMLKAKGADLSNAQIAGKFDGYSEAWSKSTFEAKSIKELMRLTEEYEEE